MSSHPLPLESELSNVDWPALEDLLEELSQLAKTTLAMDQIHRLLVERIVPAAGVLGSAVWLADGDGLRLLAQAERSPAEARGPWSAHERVIRAVLKDRQPRAVPPRSTEAGGDNEINPIAAWLIAHPFAGAAGQTCVLELIAGRELSVAAGRGYLRILAATAELLEEAYRQRELVELRQRAEVWRNYDQFAQAVHGSLDTQTTAYLIANEARRIVGCDRVSLISQWGRRCQLSAASGVDTVDRRAKAVRLLEKLTARVIKAGEPLWYAGDAAQIPEPLAKSLDAYLDESHARSVAIVPLVDPTKSPDDIRPRMIGALVAEQFSGIASGEQHERLRAVSAHAALAWNNAQQHTRLPLSGVGRQLARLRWLVEARQLPKTTLAAIVVSGILAALALVPADFQIEARGELQPGVRRDVFASDSGVVSELQVDKSRAVTSGAPLVILRKPELDLEFGRVSGEIQTAEKKLAAVRAERLDNAPQTAATRRNPHQLTADEEELKEQLKSLREQYKILERQAQALTVRSPISGQVLTWNLEQQLAARPVERGQTLLTVADVAGPWVLELDLPDKRAGHVLAARKAMRPDLPVSFALTSDPGHKYAGRIARVAPATQLDAAGDASLLVTVEFDKQQLPAMRPGATVIARIDCGRRPIGYVWLHDVFEYVQSHWW